MLLDKATGIKNSLSNFPQKLPSYIPKDYKTIICSPPSVQVDTSRKHCLALFWLTATYTGVFNLCTKVDYSGPVVCSGCLWGRFVGWDFSEAAKVYTFLGLVQVLLKSAKWFIFHEHCLQICCTLLEGNGHVSLLTAFHHVFLGVCRLSSKGRWGCHVCSCQSSKPDGNPPTLSLLVLSPWLLQRDQRPAYSVPIGYLVPSGLQAGFSPHKS